MLRHFGHLLTRSIFGSKAWKRHSQRRDEWLIKSTSGIRRASRPGQLGSGPAFASSIRGCVIRGALAAVATPTIIITASPALPETRTRPSMKIAPRCVVWNRQRGSGEDGPNCQALMYDLWAALRSTEDRVASGSGPRGVFRVGVLSAETAETGVLVRSLPG